MELDSILQRFLAALSPMKSRLRSVYLFGSRARGNARPDSDYDVLLVVTDTFTLADKDACYDVVMDLLLETGRLISLKVVKQSHFNHLSRLRTPFMTHVLTEGVKVG